MGRFDITLKQLFQTMPPGILRQLVGQEAVELLTVEFPTVKMRAPDFVARLADGRLHHLDLQSDNDDNMDWRMLEYYQLLHALYGQAPVQQVLYVGASAMNMPSRINHPHLQFDYELIDIRSLRGPDLLASARIEDNIFAVLCSLGHERETVRAILERLATFDENSRQDLYAKLSTLSDLRDADEIVTEEANRMPVVFDLRENAVFRPYLDEAEERGLAQGLAQGVVQGERQTLRRLLQKRFGPLPAWAAVRLEEANLTSLEAWSERVLDAAKLKEVFVEPEQELPVA